MGTAAPTENEKQKGARKEYDVSTVTAILQRTSIIHAQYNLEHDKRVKNLEYQGDSVSLNAPAILREIGHQ